MDLTGTDKPSSVSAPVQAHPSTSTAMVVRTAGRMCTRGTLMLHAVIRHGRRTGPLIVGIVQVYHGSVARIRFVKRTGEPTKLTEIVFACTVGFPVPPVGIEFSTRRNVVRTKWLLNRSLQRSQRVGTVLLCVLVPTLKGPVSATGLVELVVRAMADLIEILVGTAVDRLRAVRDR